MKDGDRFCDDCGSGIAVVEKSKIKTWLYYGWRVVVNLISIVVVLGIYGGVYDTDSTILVSILILIYLSVVVGFASLTWSNVEKTLLDLQNFCDLKTLIAKQSGDENKYEEDRIQLKEMEGYMKKNKTQFYINMVFNGVIYVIAVYQLISAL